MSDSKIGNRHLFPGEPPDECGQCQYCGEYASGDDMVCSIPGHGSRPRVVSLLLPKHVRGNSPAWCPWRESASRYLAEEK